MNKITLATLGQATPQEVIDQAVTHLLTQNKKSINSDEHDLCAYRGDGGLACGAGCFISDKEYFHEMEGQTWESLIALGYVPVPARIHDDLIVQIQLLHDGFPVTDWYYRLKNMCAALGLQFNPPANYNKPEDTL